MKSKSEKFPYLKNEYIEMWIEDGILFSVYNNIVIDLKAAETVLRDRLILTKGNSYPTFSDGRRVKYWTSDARAFQSGKENNIGMKAVAIYVDSHALLILIKFYLLLNKPTIPQKGFTKMNEALEWLKGFKD